MPITTAAGVADSTAAYITSAQTTANTAITALNSAVATWVSWTPEDNIEAGALSSAMDFPESDLEIKTALEAFDATLATITPPTIGAAPSLAAHTASVWSEAAWTSLKSALTEFTTQVASSGDVDALVTRLTSETDKLGVALYAKEREKKQQGLRDSMSAANAATGAKGFSFPNCMTVALQLAANQTYQFLLSDASRDLVAKIFDWAKSNWQFTVGKQVEAHTADVEFNLRYAAVLIQSYDTATKAALDEYRTAVAGETEKLSQRIKEYALRLEVVKESNQTIAQKNQVAASIYSTDMQQHVTRLTKSLEAAHYIAQQKIEAAVATVNAAANMVASANQISVGILSA